MAQTLADRVKAIPPVTRFFTITSVLVCLAIRLEFLSFDQLLWRWHYEIQDYRRIYEYSKYASRSQTAKNVFFQFIQSYRIFTSFLVPSGMLGSGPLDAVLDIYFFYTFANHLESSQGKFKGNFADCLWFTLVTGTSIVFASLVYNVVFDMRHMEVYHLMMLTCIIYVWSRYLKNLMINFFGVIPLKAYYLPLFNMGARLIISGFDSSVDVFVGILCGYLYQCIQSDTMPFYNLYPTSYGQNPSAHGANNGRRVGSLGSREENISNDWIEDSIFDKGYLKAPLWFYNLLGYPLNNSVRVTAFTRAPHHSRTASASAPMKKETNEGETSGFSWFPNEEKVVFQGKGRRLGD